MLRNPSAALRGFTLIELMIVVTLIGLITVIALPRFNGARQHAHRTQVLTDLRSLVAAQEAYWDNTKFYADDVAQLTEFNRTNNVVIEILETAGNGWSAKGTHDSDDEIECGFYTGEVTAPGIPGIKEGSVACKSG